MSPLGTAVPLGANWPATTGTTPPAIISSVKLSGQ